MLSHLNTSVQLFFVSGMVIFWLIPLSSWVMLTGQRDTNANLWFTGTAVYSVVVTLFVFNPYFPTWVRTALVSMLSGASVFFLIESMRRELPQGGVPVKRYGLLLLAWFAQIYILAELMGQDSFARALHLVLIAVAEMYLLFVARQVQRQYKSKALWVLMATFAGFILSNLSRVVEYAATGRFPLLQEFTAVGSASLVMNYLSAIFYCYGYWGFVVEKNQAMLVKVTEQAVQAREGEKLAQVGKLAQAGALSASIAHEVNQPLAAIQLNIEESRRMASEFKAPAPLLTLLTRIQQDNERAAQIVRRIRAMFKQEAPRYDMLVLDALVAQVIAMNKPRFERENISLHMSLQAPLAFEFAGGELEHILMNLLDNAIDSLRMVPMHERELTVHTWREPDWVGLSVTDSGPGVPPERKDQLFELLQTSKQQGMGLGLWLSRYIVERHGGSIALAEDHPEGACFVVKLPCRTRL